MANFNLRSPGVQVREIDTTGSNEIQVNPTIGAYVGPFEWGPANTAVRINGEAGLLRRFGSPTEATAISFLSAVNFLRYSNNLRIVRAVNKNLSDFDNIARNATVSTKSGGTLQSGMINIYNTGKHVNAANILVTISGGAIASGGTPATANVLPSQLINGNIRSINIISPGSGYTARPTITISEYNVSTQNTATVAIPTKNTVTQTDMNTLFQLVSAIDARAIGQPNTSLNVAFSSPQAIGGQTAVGYIASADWNSGTGTLTGNIKITTVGSGYYAAPTVTIYLDDGSLNAVSNIVGSFGANTVQFGSSKVWENYPLLIENSDEYYDKYYETGIAFFPPTALQNTSNVYSNTSSFGPFAARYAGDKGRGLKISVCDGPRAWYSNTTLVPDAANPPLGAYSEWIYSSSFDDAPGTSAWALEKAISNDEMHIVVVDELGLFSGVANTVLEKFSSVSKIKDARNDDGTPNYYRDVIYKRSQYIYWLNHGATQNAVNWGANSNSVPFSCGTSNDAITMILSNGYAGNTTGQDVRDTLEVLKDKETIDIDLLFIGDANIATRNKAIQVANERKDCVAFVSPSLAATMDSIPATAIVNESNQMIKSTYAVMDSGWKYVYDKYNDKYRWIPLNSDIAGLCARTDRTEDPWFSPAGSKRGQIKNSIKLAFNPKQAERDLLYTRSVNPVVTFPGEGTILFGDKTTIRRDTAFNRINVRRLFLTLEKTIADAARKSLFEFNDEFTRSQFVNLVEPFLRLVKGRRGIYDFQVVCDTTNNTPAVIDANQFIGDIYIKPARSINFIQLNFVAVRTGVEFSEVVGKVT